MGDAAHAPSPFHGQGAGQAIEDALTLIDLFTHLKSAGDVYMASAVFDQVRRPRANKNVIESRRTGRAFSMLDEEHPDMKELADGFPSRMRWLWARDMEEQSGDAIKLFESYRREGGVRA
jgi:salicylate hydroxylase